MRHFDIGSWLQAEHGNAHLVTREVGCQCREAIEQQLSTTAEGSVTTLDCRGMDHLDFTGADECFAKLISRLQALEYGDVYIVLGGLTPVQEENLFITLERKYLATLVQRKGGVEIVGHLDPYLREAFAFLKAETITTARIMVDQLGFSLSLASTKFLNLYKARLVLRRSENLVDGGREFVYRLVEGSLAAPGDTPARPRRVKG